MSYNDEISDIFARQRAERERLREEERQNRERAEQLRAMARAFLDVRHCESPVLPPGPGFYQELAGRLVRLARLLTERGCLTDLLAQVGATRATDGPHEQDARTFVVRLMQEAGAGNQETVARLLHEADEEQLPFGSLVNGWLRNGMYSIYLDDYRYGKGQAPGIAEPSQQPGSEARSDIGDCTNPLDRLLHFFQADRARNQLQIEMEDRRQEAADILRRVSHPPGCQRPETNHPSFWTPEGWAERFLEAAAALRELGTIGLPDSVLYHPKCQDVHRVCIHLWQLAFQANRELLVNELRKASVEPEVKSWWQHALLDVLDWLIEGAFPIPLNVAVVWVDTPAREEQPAQPPPAPGPEKAIGEPPAKKRRMSVEEANLKARQVAKRMGKRFFLPTLSHRHRAKLIGCAYVTWTGTELYKEGQKKGLFQPREKQAAAPSRRAVSLTASREAVAGQGEAEEVLNKLVEDEEAASQRKPRWEDAPPEVRGRLLTEHLADLEPSPLDDDPPGARPKAAWERKRL